MPHKVHKNVFFIYLSTLCCIKMNESETVRECLHWMVCDLKAASRLRVGQSRAGQAERQTPGASCEVLQSPGGARQGLHP